MKNTFPTLLPALALLTLGSCAGTAALSSTESDGIYYSSKDRTSQNVRTVASAATPADEPQSAGDEISNPDYSGGSSRSSSASGDTEYYDSGSSYSARIRRFHQPYYSGFGYGYNDFIYTDPFWYGGPAYMSYSPWGPSYYGGGFYDPFWGPTWGGSYVSINIGFGSPWYRPWRYGHGYGYGYNRGYYDGFYNGYYGGGYGGYGYGGYGGYYGGTLGGSRNVRYAPRGGRSLEATTQGRGSNSGTGTAGNGGRGRVNEGGLVAPGGGGTTNGVVGGSTVAPARGGRVAENSSSLDGTGGVRSGQVRQLSDVEVKEREAKVREAAAGNQSQTGQMDASSPGRVGSNAPETQPQQRAGRGWRVLDNSTGTQTTTSPDYSQPRRARARDIFNSGSGTNQSGAAGQSSEQPVRRQRTYEAPQRTYEAPQRTYEAPQRTYEAPQRSYDSPSRGSSGGGGNSGGGGGRGGRGRVE